MEKLIKLAVFVNLLITMALYGQVLKVDDYGAVGDGVTDDRAAIQQAFNALKANGGELQFTSGKTYIIAKGLELNFFSASHNYLITTTDKGKATIKIKDGAPISYGYWGFFIAESQNITIRNLRLDGNRDTRNPTGEVADVYLVEVRNKCDGLRFYDLELVNSVMDNIYVSVSGDETDTTRWTTDFEMYNCLLKNGYRNNMSVIRGRNYKIIGCEFDNANGHDPESGIDFEPNRGDDSDIGYENMLIEGCVFKNNKRYGIMFTHKHTSSGRSIVKNCTFDNNGLQLASQDNIIQNNVFVNMDHSSDYGGPIDGIINFIDGNAENNKIVNNYFYNNPLPDNRNLIYFSSGALGGNKVYDNYGFNNDVVGFVHNASSYSQIIGNNIFLNRGEAGYWNMDESTISGDNIEDLSDFSQTGILYGSPLIVDGKIKEALDFSPENKYIAIPLNKIMDIRGNITLSAWINWKGDNSGTEQTIIGRGSDWLFCLDASGKLKFYADSTGDGEYNGGEIKTEEAIETDSWFFVALSYNGRETKLYLNGVESAAAEAYGNLDTLTKSIYIASSKYGEKSFNGSIDDAKIFNYALSSAEIEAIYGEKSNIPDGSGREDNPYQIATLDNLIWLTQTESVWDDSAYFIQTADINAAPVDTMHLGGWNYGWLPIGNATNPFFGHYDGNGYVIDSLIIQGHSSNVGLFGFVRNFDVKDLSLTNVSITAGANAGALIGAADSNIAVTNCYADGYLESKADRCGGLIGFIHNANFDISDSHTDVTILNIGTSDGLTAGGFIGYIELTGNNEYGGIIENCYSLGDVSLTDQVGGHGYAGGFVGRVYGDQIHTKWSEIKRCYAGGDVTGAIALQGYSPAGGFIGNLNWRYKISQCYCSGDVTNMGKDTGGFVGYVKYETSIENCYSLGNVIRVSGSNQENFGGFVGYQNAWSDGETTFTNSILKCYSTGKVIGVDNNNCGFSGNFNSACLDSLNFWDIEASEQDSTQGNAAGKTTAEMKSEATFTNAGWDFTNIWEVTDDNYPALKSVYTEITEDNIFAIPNSFKLKQNYPNPFNPITTIEFSLPFSAPVRLDVYNLLGQKVAELLNKRLSAGSHKCTFNGSDFSSGLYFYKLQSGRFTQIRKMILIK